MIVQAFYIVIHPQETGMMQLNYDQYSVSSLALLIQQLLIPCFSCFYLWPVYGLTYASQFLIYYCNGLGPAVLENFLI
jgi:hypothetical protein